MRTARVLDPTSRNRLPRLAPLDGNGADEHAGTRPRPLAVRHVLTLERPIEHPRRIAHRTVHVKRDVARRTDDPTVAITDFGGDHDSHGFTRSRPSPSKSRVELSTSIDDPSPEVIEVE